MSKSPKSPDDEIDSSSLDRRSFLQQAGGTALGVGVLGLGNVGFAKNASETIGLSKRSINQDIAIATGIPRQLRDEIRGTPMEDSREDLRALARCKDPKIQKRAVTAYKNDRTLDLRRALERVRPPLPLPSILDGAERIAGVLTVLLSDDENGRKLTQIIENQDQLTDEHLNELRAALSGLAKRVQAFMDGLKEDAD